MVSPSIASITKPVVTEGQALIYEVTLSERTLGQTAANLGFGAGTSSAYLGSSLEVSYDQGRTFTRLSSPNFLLPSDLESFLVRVNTLADTTIENDETVVLTATITDDPTQTVGSGIGTVRDDDTPRSLEYVSDGRGTEGDYTVFSLDFAGNSGLPLPVSLRVQHGSAVAADLTGVLEYSFDGGETYVALAANGLVNVPGDLATMFVRVATSDDSWVEGVETFSLIAAAGSVELEGAGVILDNEFRTIASVSSPAAQEGEAAIFDVVLNGRSTVAESVDLILTQGQGLDQAAADDYINRRWVSFDNGATWTELPGTTVSMPVGTDRFKVKINTVEDVLVEYDEQLTLTARWAESVQTGTASITNDDLPTLAVSSPTVDEGANADFQISLTPNPIPFQIRFDLIAGTAVLNQDYAGGLQVSFDGGRSFQDLSTGVVDVPANTSGFMVRVTTINDVIYEGTESFSLRGSYLNYPVEATGVATINDHQDLPKVIAVSSPTVPEGSMVDFTVTLSNESRFETRVDLSLLQRTATAGVDYADQMAVSFDGGNTFVPVGSFVMVPPGHTDFRIRVQSLDDVLYENQETFALTASATMAPEAVTGVATLTDEADLPKIVSVSSPSVLEGEPLDFAVSLSNISTSSTSVRLALSAGSAQLGPDVVNGYHVSFDGGATFRPVGQDFAVPAGTKDFLVRINSVEDVLVEYDETFTLEVSANNTSAQGTGTIRNEDLPTIDISDPIAVEGAVLDFNVALTPNPIPFRLRLELINGSAAAPIDFQSGMQISWDGGGSFTALSSDMVDVPINSSGFIIRTQSNDDQIYEGNEDFYLRGTFVDYGVSDTGRAVVTDEADAPRIASVSSPTVPEGEPLVFEVSLSNTSTTPTAVQLALNGGTASVASDVNNIIEVSFDGGRSYVAGRDQLVPAGVQNFLVRVMSIEDSLVEFDESFELAVSTRINAMTGTGTIVNDDLPTIDISNPIAAEGASVDFQVGLTPNPIPFRIKLELLNGSAVAPGDFQSGMQISWDGGSSFSALSSDMVDVPANSSGFVIRTQSNQDDLYEGDEDFYLRGTFVDFSVTDTGRAKLTDDSDVPRVVSVSSTSADEGNHLVFEVKMSNPSAFATDVSLALQQGSATLGQDYLAGLEVSFNNGGSFEPVGSQVSVPPGVVNFLVRVATINDTLDESNEDLYLSAQTSADSAQGTGTIIDNDYTPTVSISDSSIEEGDYGTRYLNFTVTRAGGSPIEISGESWVDYSTSNYSAIAGIDYEAMSGTIHFNAWEASKTISVPIYGDTWVEADEQFQVTLSNASQAVIGNATATGTIYNDDVEPTLYINDIWVSEPVANHEASYVSFTVSLSQASSRDISFNWATRDGEGSSASHEPRFGRIGGFAAVTGGDWRIGLHDYDAANGSVVIPAGQTSTTVTVIVRGDDDSERDQSFYVDLSGVSNATISGSKLTGTCTIGANTSPLVLDLNGDGVHSVGLEAGVMFDNEVEGIARSIGWAHREDGLLARDLNGDGLINDGSELFGQGTQRTDGNKAADGFAALSDLDDNGDGMVDANDRAFAELRVWRDADTDGVTDAGELLSLQQAGVASLIVAHQFSDRVENGNLHALQGSYQTLDGQTREMTDVFFAVGEIAAKELIPMRIPESIQQQYGELDDEGYDWVIPDNEAAVLIRGFDESSDRLVLGDIMSGHPNEPLDNLLNFRTEGNNTVLEIQMPDEAPRQVILAGVALDEDFRLNSWLNQGRLLVE